MGTLRTLNQARLLCVRLIGRLLAEHKALLKRHMWPATCGATPAPEPASSGLARACGYRRLSRPWSASRQDRF
jgi:hypothetical protein